MSRRPFGAAGSFDLNSLFSAVTASTSRPMTSKTPAMPTSSMGSVAERDATFIKTPPFYAPISVSSRPPAITEAIWPDTFTLME